MPCDANALDVNVQTTSDASTYCVAEETQHIISDKSDTEIIPTISPKAIRPSSKHRPRSQSATKILNKPIKAISTTINIGSTLRSLTHIFNKPTDSNKKFSTRSLQFYSHTQNFHFIYQHPHHSPQTNIVVHTTQHNRPITPTKPRET
jgi:hypothetical protein